MSSWRANKWCLIRPVIHKMRFFGKLTSYNIWVTLTTFDVSWIFEAYEKVARIDLSLKSHCLIELGLLLKFTVDQKNWFWIKKVKNSLECEKIISWTKIQSKLELLGVSWIWTSLTWMNVCFLAWAIFCYFSSGIKKCGFLQKWSKMTQNIY